MGMAAALGLAAAAGLAAPAALACSLAPQTPSSAPERGPDCASVWRLGEYRSVSLSPAVDLGGGMVWQMVADGNACQAQVHAVAIDCNAGAALVVGPHDFALMQPQDAATPPMERLTDAMDAAGKAGRPMDLTTVEARARAAGLTTAFRMATRQRLNVNGKRIGIDCACKTFYPGLRPAN